MEQLVEIDLSISPFHLFSKVFSLWFENVENDGSITPDKAIVWCNFNYLLSKSRCVERQPHQSLCAYLTVASPQLRSKDMNKFKMVGGPPNFITL